MDNKGSFSLLVLSKITDEAMIQDPKEALESSYTNEGNKQYNEIVNSIAFTTIKMLVSIKKTRTS